MAEITRWPGGMPAPPTNDEIAAAPEGPELLPCPFCGGAARIDWTVRGVQRWFVRCQACDAEGSQSTACEQAAIDHWNAAGQQNAAALARMLADEQAAHERTRQELHAATQRAQRARHMHNSYWRSAHEARMCDLADRNDEITALRQQLADEQAAHAETRRVVAHHRQAATRWTNHAGVVTEQLTDALAILEEVARLGNLWPAQQLRVLKIRAAISGLYQGDEPTTTNGQPGEEGGDATV